jgi:hypothetical protein
MGRDADPNIEIFGQARKSSDVVAVLVSDHYGGDSIRRFTDFGEPASYLFGRQTAIDENPGLACDNQCGISAASATQNIESHNFFGGRRAADGGREEDYIYLFLIPSAIRRPPSAVTYRLKF